MLALLLIIGMAPQAAPATARPATPPSVQTAPLSGTALPKPEDVDPNALLKSWKALATILFRKKYNR